MNSTSRKSLVHRTLQALLICFVLLSLCRTLPGLPVVQVPVDAVAEFNRALDHFRGGSYLKALQVIEPLARRHPMVAEIQHLLAIILDLNQKPEEANQHFERAVELQPDSVCSPDKLRRQFDAFGKSLGGHGAVSESSGNLNRTIPRQASIWGTLLLQQGVLSRLSPGWKRPL